MFFCLSPDKILVYGKVFRRNIEKRGGGAYQIDHVKKKWLETYPKVPVDN